MTISILLLILVTFFTSCSKDKFIPVYSYFVSKELSLQFTKEYLTGLIDVVSDSYPEVSEIRSFIMSDIVVYKMVYKTTIEGQEIKASGLICVPSVAGDYPVLSFQNGTNTVNAYSPSEFPSDYSYQFVELIASMGYIVVIADYPGFGESSRIPHPYLVAQPTIRSLVDMQYAVKELVNSELPGITLKNEYYLIGYSQGGWATLALHKALELDYAEDFNLRGSACGAGPYDIYLLMQEIMNVTIYPMPVYLGYIVNAYINYNQFSNPVTDIFNEPYASKISSLYNGLLTSEQINNQLTTSITELVNPGFYSDFTTAAQYSSIRDALSDNSITAWHSYKPLFLFHGEEDRSVSPVSTENMYTAMIQAGTSADICSKVIIPGVGHSEAAIPGLMQGILFINNLKSSE